MTARTLICNAQSQHGPQLPANENAMKITKGQRLNAAKYWPSHKVDRGLQLAKLTLVKNVLTQ
jgi:hypothetical protein